MINLNSVNQMTAYCWLVWTTILCWMLSQTDGLPQSLKSYARVAYMRPDTAGAQLFTVEEFVNRIDGNLMLKVKDERSPSPEYKNYYRVDSTSKTQGQEIIEFDPEKNNCKFLGLDQWPLQGVTNIIKLILANSNVKKGREEASDRTALGPTALLRLILANPTDLKFNSHSERGQTYFIAEYSLSEKKTLKVLLSIPRGSFDQLRKELQQVTISSLGFFELDKLHSLKVSFVVADNDGYYFNYSPESLSENLSGLESLHISFMAIQERSVSKHQGLSAFDLDEENPFTLPKGAGCGARGKLFYLNAKQFSGLFAGERVNDQQFIAYDGRSNHLRFDRLGDSKMIYDFGGQKSVYVADPQSRGEKSSSDRCASASLLEQQSELGLSETRSMADIIGFDLGVGLNYLGSKTLEDGVHCLMFERELSSFKKTPLLAKLNLRIQPHTSDRLFLTFYFVDEFQESKRNVDQKKDRSSDRDSSLLDSIWLKRVELQSKNSLSRYNTILSQVSFSQSAWSLDVWAEYENDRKLRNLHPVRTFDSIECAPESEQSFKLELIIEQVAQANRLHNGFFERPGHLEEAAMIFLTSTTRIPRSHINELEIMLPEHRMVTSSRKPDAYRIIVEARIVDPVQFQYQRILKGWVKSYKEIAIALKESVVLLRADESSNNRHECMLNVATSIRKDIKSTLMLFCPHVGCGLIREIGSFDYIKAQDEKKSSPSGAGKEQIPTVNNHYEMCEIHQLKKITRPVDTSNKFNPEDVKSQLMNSKFSMKTMLSQNLLDMGSDDDFAGKVVKVSTTKGGHHPQQALGQLVRSGLCYTDKMLTPLGTDHSDTSKSVQISLDQHQSSAIYCHKACLLYSHCQTYSYSKATRICTLTSLSKAEVLTYALRHPDRLAKEPGCHLYGLNAMRLYKDLQMSLITSLASLDSMHQYYFTSGDRETCAGLCREHELNSEDEKTACQGFKYFSLNSMCVIEDKKSYLYKRLLDRPSMSSENSYDDKSKYFKSLLAHQSDWDEVNQCQFYERDYSQYYDLKFRTKFNLAGDGAVNQPAGSIELKAGDVRSAKLSELKTLYDIDLRDCLRECLIVERNCIMVDHCFHPIHGTPTKYCAMFQIESHLDKLQAEEVLNQLLLLQSNERTTDDRQAPSFKRNPSCSNYRLTKDYLMLKTKIVEASLSKDGQLEEISRQDANRSDSYLGGMKNFINGQLLNDEQPVEGKQFGFWSATLMLLIGSISGLLAALFLVEQPRVRPTIEVISNSGSSGTSIASSSSNISGFKMTQALVSDLQRSQSKRHEYNELFELYEN